VNPEKPSPREKTLYQTEGMLMIHLLKTIRKSAIISLAALTLCMGGFVHDDAAEAQEAPRDSGSLIKPPTIKPPTARSQNSNSGTPGSKRRKIRRRRRARRRAAATTAPKGNGGAVLSKASGDGASPNIMVGSAPRNSIGGPTASIKPPTETAEGSMLSTPHPRKPISGGVLNGRATSLPKPPFPPIARAARASGTVVVQVLVDEDGNVMEAHAVSGHPLLQNAAKEAALQARFAPTRLSGQPVKVTGVITYDFVP
jgi:protein TonB